MLLNSVIIILREVIEASLLISILLAFGNKAHIPRSWVWFALTAGLSTAALYALNITAISQWYDGVGQEVVNAALQFIIYILLLLFVSFTFYAQQGYYRKVIRIVMILIVVLAMTREGSEIILYIRGFRHNEALLQTVLFGAMIGAGIGMSVGILFYYLLITLPKKISMLTGFSLYVLVAGGMILQAIQLLTQADWIESQYPLWDTSSWISERSIPGQILYALISYEATPTATQVVSYVIAIALMTIMAIFSSKHAARIKE